MLTLQRVRRRSFWLGPTWGVAGLVAGSGGGLFAAAAMLTLVGRSVLGWEPALVGLVLTGGGAAGSSAVAGGFHRGQA